MRLTQEQLTHLFNIYLKTFVIPGSSNHLPMFETIDGGAILTRRLYKILRDKELTYLVTGDKVNIVELYTKALKEIKKHKKVYIVGLNHWFTETDLKTLRKLYEKYF